MLGRAGLTTLAMIATACATAPAPTRNAAPSTKPLTEQERELVARGEITRGKHVGGGLVGTLVGFGLGHAIQDRWISRGWIYTVGEVGSLGTVVVWTKLCFGDLLEADEGGNLPPVCDEPLVAAWWIGAFTFAAFRVVESADVWVDPKHHNQRVRALRERSREPAVGVSVAPARHGVSASLTVRF